MGWYSTEHLPLEAHHPEHKLLATVIRDICASSILMAILSGFARQLEYYHNKSGVGNSV